MTITPELIDVCQQPPRRDEPDVGTVDPFTRAELAAIYEYNAAVDGIPDMLPEDVGALDEQQRSLYRVAHDAHAYMRALYDWHTALDSLDSELRDGSGHLSSAADRLLSHEAGNLISHGDRVRAAIARLVTGMTGPRLTDGALQLSNGYVQVR
jgi:hypothetical protein